MSGWDEDLHPRDESGRFTDGDGSSSARVDDNGDYVADRSVTGAREFSSDDGYAWHEVGPGAKWAASTPTDDDLRHISDYAGFGYSDINGTLRGTPPTKTDSIRQMTDDEVAKYEAWTRSDGDSAPPIPPEGAAFSYKWDWVGDYIKDKDVGRRERFIVVGPVVDEARKANAQERAERLDAVIRERGLVLSEPMTVFRASYLPGVTKMGLEDKVGQVFEEKGFTSTMLGTAGNRLDGYVGWGKFESISRRYGTSSGTLAKHQDEPGVAMRIKIALPAGTKVAAVEAARREDRERQDKDRAKRYEREYEPPSEERRKDQRTESEILIGAGAKFKITRVANRTQTYDSGDRTLKPVTIVDVEMEYVGGGSSEGDR